MHQDNSRMPDQFVFIDLNSVVPSTQYTSNSITVSGTDLPVSISGGEYSKNGGAFTSAPGTAVIGDTFEVRQTSSGNSSTANITTLTIGGVSEVFATTTAAGSVGNLVEPASWADFKAAIAAGLGAGGYTTYDVVDLRGIATVDPDDITFDTTYPAPGIVIVANPNQIVRMSLANRAHNIRFVGGWNFGADTVSGTVSNGQTLPSGYGLNASNATNWSVEGSVFNNNANGIFTAGSSNFSIINNLFINFRDNGVQMSSYYSQITTGIIQGNKFRESLYVPRTYYSITGADPVFNVDPGGYQYIDPNHIDAIQWFFDTLGPIEDVNLIGNDIAGRMQGIFISDGQSLRVNVSDNDISTSGSWPLQISGADLTVIGNTATVYSDPDPSVSNENFATFSNAGTGKIWGGQNILGSGVTQNTAGYSIDLTSGTLNGAGGVAALPVNPGYTGFEPTVVDMAALTALPTYTPYSGPVVAVLDSHPLTFNGGDTPTTTADQGDWLFAYPPIVYGYFFGIEEDFYTRWRCVSTNTIVQAAGQGPAYMKYQAGAIPDVRPEWSYDGVNYTNGATVTLTPLATSLDPSRKSTNITLSNGNLTATDTGTDNTHSLAHSIGSIPVQDGTWFFEYEGIPISGSQMGIALVRPDKATNIDPHDYDGPCFALFGNGQGYGSNGMAFNIGGMTGSNANYGSGKKYGVTVRRSGGSGGTVKLFIQFPDGTYSTGGGNPNSGGAGHDISAAFASAAISCPGYTYKTGDVANMNFGGSSYTRTKPTGAANVPLT